MVLKRKIILGTALVALVSAAFAVLAGNGNTSTVMQKFYSAVVSEKSGVSIRRNIAYGTNGRHRLNIYEPSNGDGAGPIVIFLYGGAAFARPRISVPLALR